MPANVKSSIANGIQLMYWSTLNGNTPNGTVTTPLAAGSSAGMGRLRGITALEVSEPDASTITATGNNGVLGQFLGEAQELPSGNLNMTALDAAFNAVATGTRVNDDGDFSWLPGLPLCLNFADLAFVVNSPAQSQDPASLGTSGFVVAELFRVKAQMKTFGTMQTNTIQEFANRLILNRAGSGLSGVPFSASVDGTRQMAGRRSFSDFPVTYHTFVGNGTLTTVTLDETPAAASGARVQVWVGGTPLAYGTGFTVNTTTRVLTFLTAPANNVIVVIRYQHLLVC